MNPPAAKTFPMKEAEQLQRPVCLTRGWGKSHMLLRLLEEFHKLLTSARNPSKKFLVNVGFRFYFCGYLQSILQRVYIQRAKHTGTTAQLVEMPLQRRTEDFYHPDISVSCLTSSLCPRHIPKGETIKTRTLLASFPLHGLLDF